MTLYDSTNEPVLPEHTVRAIFDPDGKKPPFAYTVGLASRPGRSYELATFGLPNRFAHAVITCAAKQLTKDHLDPAEGLELDEVLLGGYRVPSAPRDGHQQVHRRARAVRAGRARLADPHPRQVGALP
ncbi:DUF4262 domain-containing protein [Streptomyces sp. NPDC050508]|uniref:DUF4262 domain-containing protein n=1 Tax=Streptomyces sp. NPDC050508 TaxID=3155405 RepID=UPI003428A1CE